MDNNHTVIVFNVLLLLVIGGAIAVWIFLQKKQYRILSTFIIGGLIPVGSFVGLILLPVDLFLKIQLLTWVVLLHTPLYFMAVSILLLKRKSKWGPVLLISSLAVFTAAVYAVFIEPQWLEVTNYTITTDKLTEPLRIVIIADIQTDTPGAFEERALKLTKEANSDLILLAGDYLQISEVSDYQQAKHILNGIFKRANLNPPLGILAVQGNIDAGRPWFEIFKDLPIETISYTRTTDLGPVVLTGLSMEDSFNTALTVSPEEKFHILLGHCPNFSLGENDANLLVAGHTHGGQVRIPFIGPLLTFSYVPRSWAHGMAQIAENKNLIVSRGLGMERHTAPRLRFLCRPQLVIVDLEPK